MSTFTEEVVGEDVSALLVSEYLITTILHWHVRAIETWFDATANGPRS